MQSAEAIGGQLEILDRDDVDRIHGATMQVYERAGIKVWLPEALRLFADAGARIDTKNSMVYPSESFVKDVLKHVPEEFYLYGRDPSLKYLYGKKRVHFSLMGMSVKVHDLEGNVRLATTRDVEDLARLSDWCENLDHTSIMTTPMDVSQDALHMHTLWAILRNSRKPCDGYSWTRKWTEECFGLASIVRGGKEELMKKPLLLGFVNPLSPLQLSKELAEGSIASARWNQPTLYAPEALSGGTAPATLAGLLVQQNAEVLSGIMMAQLANPGAPVLYGTVSATLDMRHGATALGGPEVGLINLATAQIARRYRIPSRGTGGNTDSKVVDSQSAQESALSLYAAALAGIDFVYDAAGSLESSLTISYEKVVIDNELCGIVKRLLRGIEVNDDTLAVEEICRVGSKAGHLGSMFTLNNFRREHFLPSLADRRTRDAWNAAGGKDLASVAREKAKQVLKRHVVPPLEKDVEKEAQAYVKKVLKGYC